MMNRSKLVATLVASLALAPVLAAGRPACCIKKPVTSIAPHGCCAAMAAAQASAPKGCCKAPVAPKPETRVKDTVQVVLAVPSLEFGSPAQAALTLPEAAAVRLARCAHHAEAPDDSPPDLLSRIHVLLI